MSSRTVIESQVRAIQTQLKLLRSLLQQEAAALSQQYTSGLEEGSLLSEHPEVAHLREVQSQIQAFEGKVQMLRERLNLTRGAQTLPRTVSTLGELRGILKGKAHSTEAQIREAQIQSVWI